jgi:N-acetylmuramoyl-L-alanine amidase
MIFIERSKKFSQFFDESSQVRNIGFIILHHIEADSVNHAVEMLKEHQVSSHFLIDENGDIFELVDENNIAYHAGVSNWQGIEGLNKCSIGIEFINSKAFEKNFQEAQMKAGLELCKYLMNKYNIKRENVIGHSDIAYDKTTNLHNRKQDPSHLFDWKFLAENGVGVFPQSTKSHVKIFSFGDKDQKIKSIKAKLAKIGYRVINQNEDFDEEMQSLSIVFNRKFLGKEIDFWCEKSDDVLNQLI